MKKIKEILQNVKENAMNAKEKQNEIKKNNKNNKDFSVQIDQFNSIYYTKNNLPIDIKIYKKLREGVLLNDGIHKLIMKLNVDNSDELLCIVKDDIAVFENAINGDDLQYVINERGVKENIVVNNKKDAYQYFFTITHENMLLISEDNNLSFVDKNTNEKVFKISKLIMKDSFDNQSSDVAIEIVESNVNNGVSIIKFIASSSWINSDERVFPIQIDPSIELVNKEVIVETASYKNNILLSYKQEKCYVGLYNDNYSMKLVLNIKKIKERIVDSKHASFKLFLELFYKNEIRMNQSPGFIISFKNNEIIDTFSLNETEGKIHIDITSLVKSACNENLSNIELFVKRNEDESASEGFDYVSFYTNDAETEKMPNVILKAANDVIKKDASNVKMFDSNRSGISLYNLYNGDFRHIHNDTDIKENKLNFTIKHIFDISSLHNSEEDKHMGKGWKSNLHQQLIKKDYDELLGGYVVEYVDELNNKHTFIERFYYMQNKQKHFIKKEFVYKDEDGKLKYKLFNNVSDILEVTYEVSSLESNLTYVSAENTYCFYEEEDIEKECNKQYYFLFKDKTKYEIKLNNNATVNIPSYYYLENGSDKVYVEFKNITFDENNQPYYNDIALIIGNDQKGKITSDDDGLYLSYGISLPASGYVAKERIFKNVTYLANITKKLDNVYLTEDILNVDNQLKQVKSQLDSFKNQVKEIEEKYISFDDETNPYTNEYKNAINEVFKYEKLYNDLLLKRNELIKEQTRQANDYIIDGNNNILGFDGHGRLVLISDNYDNYFCIQYDDDKIVSLYTDKQKVQFVYDDVTKLLTKVIDAKGNITSYKYKNDDLCEIIYSHGESTKFEIGQDYFKVQSIYGHNYNFQFVNDDKTIITDYIFKGSISDTNQLNSQHHLLQTYLIERTYENNQVLVKVTNLYDDVECYLFDNLGRLVSYENIDCEIEYNHYSDSDKLLYDVVCKEKKSLSTFTSLSGSYVLKKQDIPLSNMVALKCNLDNFDVDDVSILKITLKAKVVYSNHSKTFIQEYQAVSNQSLVLPICIPSYEDVTIYYYISSTTSSLQSKVSNVALYECSGEIYSYDNKNRCILMQSGNKTITYGEFVNDLPTLMISSDPLNNTKTAKIKYDMDGKILFEQSFDKDCVEYIYDDKSNVIKKKTYNIKDPSLCNVSVFNYDEKGNLVDDNHDKSFVTRHYESNNLTSIYANNYHNTLKYTCDLLTNVKCKENEYDYTYDGLKRIIKIAINKEVVARYYYNDDFSYNELEHCSSVVFVKKDGYGWKKIFDKNGLLLTKLFGGFNTSLDEPEIVVNNGNNTYTYDDKKISKITDSSGNSEEYEYDKFDRITSKTIKNGSMQAILSYTYDDYNRLIESKLETNDGDDKQVEVYEYDEENTNELYKTSFDFGMNVSNKYDALKRLIKNDTISKSDVLFTNEYTYLQEDENTTNKIYKLYGYVISYSLLLNETMFPLSS